MKKKNFLNIVAYSFLITSFCVASASNQEVKAAPLENWQDLCNNAPKECNPTPSGGCDDSDDCYGAIPKVCTDYAKIHNNQIYFYNDCFNQGCGISCQPNSEVGKVHPERKTYHK